MTEDQRTAVLIAADGDALQECRACRWLGDDAEKFDPETRRFTHSECPACGSRDVRDYESALYELGY